MNLEERLKIVVAQREEAKERYLKCQGAVELLELMIEQQKENDLLSDDNRSEGEYNLEG
jgi:hypothetical protein